jgi:hypothetical protein
MTTTAIFELFFSAIVPVCTVVYSILTWKLVIETRKMREFQISPDINIYFEPSQTDVSLIHLVFKNCGQGYARNVKFEVLKNFENYDSNSFDIKNTGLIQDGIDNFYSNQSFKFFFTDLTKNTQSKKADHLLIRTTFEDINGKKNSKDTKLSLNQFSMIGLIEPPDNYIGRISYELHEIRKILIKK